ncbi:hypothetical protein BC936DRAFT_139113 [Jimgerdemannia flammicorona]|uniref:Uncharacterized protein n=1 Tax=Jimgerdemannia flammicorona TaxID=994334 RepID=A0A433BAM5_9FUNG|nr:hypothetical protein BC936DRAFT_139113 [Jimgerdemannia flammicorona]
MYKEWSRPEKEYRNPMHVELKQAPKTGRLFWTRNRLKTGRRSTRIVLFSMRGGRVTVHTIRGLTVCVFVAKKGFNAGHIVRANTPGTGHIEEEEVTSAHGPALIN